MSSKRVLTLEIHAESDDCLDKLLDLAIFELVEYRKNGGARWSGKVVSRNTSGTAGTFNLEYLQCSEEAKALIEKLEGDGYKYNGFYGLGGEVVFEQEGTQRLIQLLENPARTEPYVSFI